MDRIRSNQPDLTKDSDKDFYTKLNQQLENILIRFGVEEGLAQAQGKGQIGDALRQQRLTIYANARQIPGISIKSLARGLHYRWKPAHGGTSSFLKRK